jgi:hypothetical protein
MVLYAVAAMVLAVWALRKAMASANTVERVNVLVPLMVADGGHAHIPARPDRELVVTATGGEHGKPESET